MIDVYINCNTKKYLLEQSKKYWISNNNKTQYQKGFIGNGDYPYLPVFLGLLGEKAFSIITKTEIDFEYKLFGDGGYDFLYKNKKINIKNTITKNQNVAGYIKKHKKHHSDFYVFCRTFNFKNFNNNTKVTFKGYITKTELINMPFKAGLDGKDMYVIENKNLNNLGDLIYG